jgi:hypothetical protein
MLEWLVGGGIGLVAGAFGMGFLLWRERGKRATADLRVKELEQSLDDCEDNLDRQTGRAATLSKLVARKESRIAELEAQLAAVNPGSLLDSVFDGGVPQVPTAGQAGPKK